MTCKKCERQLKDGVKFCVYCGEKVFVSAKMKNTYVNEMYSRRNNSPTKGGGGAKSRKILTCTLAAAIVLALALSLAWYVGIPLQRVSHERIESFLDDRDSFRVLRGNNSSYVSYEIISRNANLLNRTDTVTLIVNNRYRYMSSKTTMVIEFEFDSYSKEWNGKIIDTIHTEENWSISGNYGFNYKYKMGNAETIIDFILLVHNFDGKVLECDYSYQVRDKTSRDDWRYSTDSQNGKIDVDSRYQYMGNLFSNNHGQIFDYYWGLHDSLKSGSKQPYILIDRDAGILLNTGRETWDPLHELIDGDTVYVTAW